MLPCLLASLGPLVVSGRMHQGDTAGIASERQGICGGFLLDDTEHTSEGSGWIEREEQE